MGLRDLWNRLEDAYYGVLDWLEEKGIPVFSIVDPIDSLVPSFAVLLLIVAAVAGVVVYNGLQTVSNELVIVDSSGEPVALAQVTIETRAGRQSFSSDETGKVFFGLSSLERIEITVRKTGFLENRFWETIPQTGLRKQIQLWRENESGAFEIRFVSQEQQVIVGKRISFSLSCSTPNVNPERMAWRVSSEDRVLLSLPPNCGNALVTITAPSDYRQRSYVVSPSQPLIVLESADNQIPARTGSLNVWINWTTTLDPSPVLSVVLFKNKRFVREQPVVNGRARFEELEEGIYTVLVGDATNQLSFHREESVAVEAEQEKQLSLALSSESEQSIRVRVFNRLTQQGIPNAVIRLVHPTNGNVFAQLESAENGIAQVKFANAIGERALVAVQAPGFFSTTSIQMIQDEISLGLDPVSQSEKGIVEVTVVNSSGERVEHAAVWMILPESGLIRQEIAVLYTDSNGKARWQGVPSGTTQIMAEKGLQRGQSQSFSTQASQAKSVEVRLDSRTTGQLVVRLKNSQNQAVADARVEVWDSQQAVVESHQSDNEGKAIFLLTTEERFSIAVYPENGGPIFSEPFAMPVNLERNILVPTEMTNVNQVQLDFVRLEDREGKPISKLIRGEQGIAVFSWRIPAQPDFAKTGAVFYLDPRDREQGVGIESIQVREAAVQVVDEQQNQSNFGIRGWALKETPEPGVFEIRIVLTTRANSPERFSLFAGIWAVERSGNWQSRPENPNLGNDAQVFLKLIGAGQRLETEASESECNQLVCFLAPTIIDRETGQWIGSGSPLIKNHAYTISLEWSGKGTENLAIEDLEIALARGNNENTLWISEGIWEQRGRILPLAWSDNKSEPVSGVLPNGEKSVVRLQVNAVAAGWQSISWRAEINGEEVVYSFPVEVEGSRLLTLTLSSALVAGTENNVEVTILDAESSVALSDARILVRLVSANQERREWGITTNEDGKAVLVIPATSIGSRLVLNARKTGYRSALLEENFEPWLVFDPTEVTLALHNQALSVSSNVIIRNVGRNALEIFSPELSQPLLVGLEWSSAGVTEGLALGEQKEIVTGTATITDAELLARAQVLTRSLLWQVKESASEREFVFAQPLSLRLGGGSNALLQGCLKISPVTWQGITENDQAVVSVTVRNECSNALNQPLSLDGIEARVSWNGAKTGNVEVREEKENGDRVSTVLSSNWSSIATVFAAREEKEWQVVFTPVSSSLGKTASLNIEFAGLKQGQPRILSRLPTELLLANIQECLIFSPRPFEEVLIPFGGSNSFTVDASLCGTIPLSISLCPNDPGCKGGATKGEINLNPATFELNPQHPTQTVSVRSVDLPGAYGIEVGVESEGVNAGIITTMEVNVENNPNEHFALNKFEFFVLPNQMDSAILYNSNVSKTVTVRASAEDWANTQDPNAGGLDGAGAAGEGLDSEAIEALEPGAQEAKTAAQQLAGFVADGLDQARQQTSQAMGKQNEAADQTKQAQDTIGQGLGMANQGSQVAQAIVTDCGPLTACANKPSTILICQAAPEQAARICASAQSLFGGIAQGVKAPLEGASEAAQRATQNMGDSIPQNSDVGYALPKAKETVFRAELSAESISLQSTSTATGAADQALQQINQSRSDAAVDASADTSSGASTASQQAQQSCQSSQQASQKDKEAQQNSQQGGQNLIGAGTGLGMNVAQTALFESQVLTSCIQAPCAAQITKMRQTFYGFKALQTGLQSGQASVPQGQEDNDKANQGQQAADAASTSASQAACETSRRLREFSEATAPLSENSGGAEGEVQENITNATSALGVVEGMRNGIYQNENVGNRLTGFLINLVNDARDIEVEQTGISGRFNTVQAKIWDQYRSQSVGVVFENNGVQETAPLYRTTRIRATQHTYTDPLLVPPGASNWGMFRLESFGQSQPYEPEFHLKFVTSEKAQTHSILETDAQSCVQGTRIGQTGSAALPQIKLAWNWSSIPINACQVSEPGGFYCDAVQFSIMITKRLKALEEFLQSNPGLPCPVNPYQVELDREMDAMDPFLGEVGREAFSASDWISSCWVPESTRMLDGKAALEYYVAQAGNGIQWTASVPNAPALHDLLFFEADLIQDGFSDDFVNDFARFYTTTNFSDTPSYFFSNDNPRTFSRLFTPEFIEIREIYSNQARLPTSGRYRANLVVDFGPSWQWFDEQNNPTAHIRIELQAQSQVASTNPFYFIPFDGAVGLEGEQLQREGYGTAFAVRTEEAFNIARQSFSRTWASRGGAPLQALQVRQLQTLEETNARPSQRGILLDVQSLSDQEKRLVFSPTLVTPVVLRTTTTHQEPFSVYWVMREGENEVSSNGPSSYWSGVGETCLDYSGEKMSDLFRETPDRKTGEGDQVETRWWEKAHALDWDVINKRGSVFLRSFFFTPTTSSFSVQMDSENAAFYSPNQSATNVLELSGIGDMPFNRGTVAETDKLTALDDLFELVKQGFVCVSNEGQRTQYWWNETALAEESGLTGESLSNLESDAATQCIQS